MTILLVEDHEDTREALQNLLKKRGHVVFTAADVKSALAIGLGTDCDLLMCDLQLPDGSGYQLLQALRTDRKILALAMSGHCAPSDLARTKASGFFTHLIKPYGIGEVQSALASAESELQREKESAAD